MVNNKRIVILVNDDNVTINIPELKSNREEVNSQMILYCNLGVKQGYQYARVKGSSSDIWIIMCCYRNIGTAILFDICHGDKHQHSISHYTHKMCKTKDVSKCDLEIPQSHAADQPTVP